MPKTTYAYQEVQPMMPTKMIAVAIVLLVIVMGLFGYMYIAQVFFEQAVGENALPASWALVIFLATALLTYYVSRLKIMIKVDDEYLTIGLGVIGKKRFRLNRIQSASVYEGNPAVDFLGYGYRIGLKRVGYVGRAEQAVSLKLQDESRDLVITTEDAEAFLKALKPDT